MAYTLNLGFSDEKSCEFKSRLQQARKAERKTRWKLRNTGEKEGFESDIEGQIEEEPWSKEPGIEEKEVRPWVGKSREERCFP
jgi:hypothetical protein